MHNPFDFLITVHVSLLLLFFVYLFIHLFIFLLAGVITFSKIPSDKIYHQKGYDAVFNWDYVKTDKLRSTIWRVYNKTKGAYDILRVEDENGTIVVDPAIPPAAYVGRLERKGRGTLIVKNVTFEDSTKFKCTLTEKVTLLTTESSLDLIVTGEFCFLFNVQCSL